MTHSGQQQLPLPVYLRDEATFDNFFSHGSLQSVVAALLQQAQGTGESLVYLYGSPGTGKSHLLQASCHHAGGAAIYLPLAELDRYQPEEIFQGVEALSLVCLDDIELVLGRPEWELALFNLYNRARDNDCRLLVAGNTAPRLLPVILADLQSRLSWSVIYQLEDGRDEDKIAILQFRADRRGFKLSEEVCRYIVTRAPRDTQALLALLDKLDTASLAQQRSLSIPFVRGVLDG